MIDSKSILKNLGFRQLNSIQNVTFECDSKNWMLYANTGSGKTVAFLLPVFKELSLNKQSKALVIAPTRELILQIESVWKKMKTEITSTACYGGHKIEVERRNLEVQPRVIFATPGRICDLERRQIINFSDCNVLVIDEFDKALEFGFKKEMTTIFDKTQSRHATFLTSATRYTDEDFNLSYFKEFNFISTENKPKINEIGVQSIHNSVEELSRLINSFQQEQSIVFVNYREVADDIAQKLKSLEHFCAVYHGGLPQDKREKELIRFSNQSALVLVCTDLGSRGLDIPDVKHIIHWQYPESKAAFIHRSGRTGRNDSEGNSYLFLSDEKTLPMYLDQPEKVIPLPSYSKKHIPKMKSIYVGAGKKNKINKIDLLGFFCQQGDLIKTEIGMIVVRDYFSILAIQSNKFESTLKKCQHKKIKGKKIKIGRFRG